MEGGGEGREGRRRERGKEKGGRREGEGREGGRGEGGRGGTHGTTWTSQDIPGHMGPFEPGMSIGMKEPWDIPGHPGRLGTSRNIPGHMGPGGHFRTGRTIDGNSGHL